MNRCALSAVLMLLLLLAASLSGQRVAREQVGPQEGGGFLLNSGWRLRPAGKQVPLGTFPMSTALSPDGRYLLVLNAGYRPPSISVLDLSSEREIGRTPVKDGWLGLTFSPDGKFVYVGGGAEAAVFEYAFSDGILKPARTFSVVPPEKRTERDFVGDVAFPPKGRLLYVTSLYQDMVLVVNPQSGRVIEQFKTRRRPYRILFHPDGASFFVSSWADGRVAQHQTEDGSLLEAALLGPHPNDMVFSDKPVMPAMGGATLWASRIFVAAGNTNSVYVLGVSEGMTLRRIETINIALAPNQPAGMTPSALALSADQSKLFVVCSDANVVAVVDISDDRSRVAGFIPTGWYPTAVRSLADGRVIVLNGRGAGSFSNLNGPESVDLASTEQYVGNMQIGSASFIEPFSEEDLDSYSATVGSNLPLRGEEQEETESGSGVVPLLSGDSSPIEHVIYIVKENQTYDQVLGDVREGNGSPSLALFGQEVTPNHHKLAREFVLFDNFYANGDVDADGLSWSTAAIASDYVQRMWPHWYRRGEPFQEAAGGEPTAVPPAGYLWSNAASAGLSIRNYGFRVVNRSKPSPEGVHVESVRDSALNRSTNLLYRGPDLDYPDVERAKVFLEDLKQFESTGQMPRLIVMRLGNDRTSGDAPGKIAPSAAMADNDYALGLIVDAMSRSRFWAQTAIFVLEDDGQDGRDHVDSHRVPAFILSPYTRRGAVDSAMYNTTSMLRTIERILDLRPMTHFDTLARPMVSAFQPEPDTRPYTAEKPRISLERRNPPASP